MWIMSITLNFFSELGWVYFVVSGANWAESVLHFHCEGDVLLHLSSCLFLQADPYAHLPGGTGPYFVEMFNSAAV